MSRFVRIGIARGGCVLLPCVATTLGTGCAARVYSESEAAVVSPAPVEEDAVVYIDTVPPDIETYPHYYYGGGYAYYVEGRWYRHGPRGWGYYRQEPPQLERQRVHAVQQAPAPAIPHERSEAERTPAAPRERASAPQAPAPAIPRERSDVERAPAAPRERPSAPQAPAASRPSQGVVEAQPHSPEAPRRAPPATKRNAPPKEHER